MQVDFPDGRKMNVWYETNTSAKAPTLLLVHGFPLDHSMWQHQAPLLDEYSILAPDLFGFGASDPVADSLSMKSMADDLAQLLDCLDLPEVIFCGLSMGGYIGWEFFARHRSRLAGLICCNTRAASDDELTARARRMAAKQVVEKGTKPIAAAMRVKLFAESTRHERSQLVEDVIAVIERTKPASIAAGQLAMARRQDHVRLLAHIDVPTLVVAGECDEITPAEEMQQLAVQIPASDFVAISNAGHMTPLEQPAAFNESVRQFSERCS